MASATSVGSHSSSPSSSHSSDEEDASDADSAAEEGAHPIPAPPRDDVEFVERLPQGIHIFAYCTLESLIGHDAYDAVMWRPLRCKSTRARKAIADLMLNIAARQAPVSQRWTATALYLVRGPRAAKDVLHLIDPEIRSRTRRELGISELSECMESVVIVGGGPMDDMNDSSDSA